MMFKKVYLIILLALSILAAAGLAWARAPQSTFIDSGQNLGGNIESSDVALGDLDGDSDLDAVVASYGADSPVYINQGGAQAGIPGIFLPAGFTLSESSANDVAIDDLDGDGDLDIFILKDAFGDSNEVFINQGGVQGGTEGNFVFSGQVFGDQLSTSVALGDLDGANGPDAFVGRGFGQASKVWLNNGSSSFIDSGQSLDNDSSDVALGDLDGDLDLDAFSANGGDNKVWVNQGGAQMGTPGTFLDSGQVLTSTLSNSVGLGDLDGDGDLDAWVGNSGIDRIWVNQGGLQGGTQGVFLQGAGTSQNSTRDVALGDLDGDGDLDAFVAKGFGNEVWVNQGGAQVGTQGVFLDSGQSLGNSFSEGLDLGDLDGDTDLDAFVANWPNPDKVWLNQASSPPPTGEGWQASLIEARGDSGRSVDAVLDQDGHLHVSYVSYQPVESGDDYELRYSYWDGLRWHTEVVDQAPYINYHIVGEGYTSLALDSSGEAHIAYAAGGFEDLDLQYAHRTGSTWTVETVEGGGEAGVHVSLAIAPDGTPRIAYYNNDFTDLMYAKKVGGSWQVELVDGMGSQAGRFNDLVLDAAGQPHISYYHASTQEIRHAFHDGNGWNLETVDDSNPNSSSAYTAITLDGSGNPAIAYNWDTEGAKLKYAHWDGAVWQIETLYSNFSLETQNQVSLAFDGDDAPHIVFSPGDVLLYIEKTGGSWTSISLDNNGVVGEFSAMALDSQGKPHVAYHAADYGDLRYIRWGPDWEVRALNTGTVQSPAVQIYNTLPSIGYYDINSGQVNLARWDSNWGFFPAAFVSNPTLYVDHAVGRIAEHITYYDADSSRLMYAQRSGGSWTLLPVDETGDVGRFNDIELFRRFDSTPRIAYWDASLNRVKAALLNGTSKPPVLHTNTTGPALNGDSGYTHLTYLPENTLGISYYDGVNGDLRFATLKTTTGVWTDEVIDGILGADVGRLNDAKTDGTDGYPVVAYYDETNDAIKMAYDDGAWQIQTAVANAGGVLDLVLELGLGTRGRARIAYTTGSAALKLAALEDGVWTIDTVHGGALWTDEVSLDLDDRAHLGYNYAGALYYAFRSSSLDVDISLPMDLPPESDGYYNPLDACQATLGFLLGGDRPAAEPGRGMLIPTNQAEPLDDEAIFLGLAGLFAASTGGQFYFGLYAQHGQEMGQIGLDDPALLWDAYGTLQNFLPGLEAFVTGRGSELLVTQQMVEDALDIWQRLAAAGSPELANIINTELAKTNDLQDFVGMTFDDWALALGVQPPANIYLPVVIRE